MPHSRRVLILGAGVAGQQAARAMREHPAAGYEPIGFADDDLSKAATRLEDLPVLGGSKDIPQLVATYDVDEILIAMPSETGATIRRLVRACEDVGVAFKIVPGIREIILGDVRIDQIRHVEPEDLLGRESVAFDPQAAPDYLRGQVVLITGAGGSIGSELCRQVALGEPERLVLLGRGENSIFAIENELRAAGSTTPVTPIIADVRDARHLESVCQSLRPGIVFHAAAHKHVHYMERFPEEAVLRNVVGTFNLLEAAAAGGAERFVFISTDKAAEPQSVMGASKRLAEDVVRFGNRSMRCMAVRFGNVLGSRGSVVPLFKRQIARGGPVTVSDAEATRYFMTVREAAFLVIQAGAIGRGRDLFILDMGQPIRILDLARELITLSGYRPEVDIPITFTGLRPGEKRHERLWVSGENVVATEHPQILELQEETRDSSADLPALVRELEALAEACETEAVLARLRQVVPGYVGGPGAPGADARVAER